MNIKNSKLRIIAGKFRGRKIFFNDQNVALRPTLNRVRETVFNWLAPYMLGANCLDLFAGSGIFSFESLSRGANCTLAIEQNHNTCQNILKNKVILNLKDQEFKIMNQDVLLFLKKPNLLEDSDSNIFNIIFLDPPYNQNQQLLLASLNLLVSNNFLRYGSKIYFECDKDNSIFKEKNFPRTLQLIKSSKAGRVYFYLVEYVA